MRRLWWWSTNYPRYSSSNNIIRWRGEFQQRHYGWHYICFITDSVSAKTETRIYFGSHIRTLLGSPTLVGRLKLYCWVFLLEHFFQQPRRGRPANAHQRFGHRCSYKNRPIHLAHPSTNFYRGLQSTIFGLIAQQRANLSRCGLETEQCTLTIFKLGVRWLSDKVPTKFGADLVQIWWFLKSPMLRLEHPVKTDEKYVVNHQ